MAFIVIDIGNDPDVHSYLITAFSELQWNVSLSAFKENPAWNDYRNKTAKYFVIDMQVQRFAWYKNDSEMPDEEQQVYSLVDAVELMQFVKDNADILRTPTDWDMYAKDWQMQYPIEQKKVEDNFELIGIDSFGSFITAPSKKTMEDIELAASKIFEATKVKEKFFFISDTHSGHVAKPHKSHKIKLSPEQQASLKKMINDEYTGYFGIMTDGKYHKCK